MTEIPLVRRSHLKAKWTLLQNIVSRQLALPAGRRGKLLPVPHPHRVVVYYTDYNGRKRIVTWHLAHVRIIDPRKGVPS